MLKIIYGFIFALAGGFISRDCGTDKPVLPFGLSQFVYALPYAAVLAPFSLWAAALAYAFAVWGKRTGHGQYIHLGRGEHDPKKNEQFDPIVKLFFGADKGGRYWRCVFGLAVTGLVVTLPAGILLGYYGTAWAGLGLALSGASKAGAYMLGWALHDHVDDDIPATVIGEFLTGAFAYTALFIIGYSGVL